MRNMGRVKEKSSTTGLANYELTLSAANLLRCRDVHADTAWLEYYASDGSNFERGIGQLAYGSPDTLSRADARILQSSNGGARVNWSAGVRDVFVDPMPGCRPVIDVSSTRTISAVDYGAVLRFTGASAATWTLPSAVNLGDGFSFEFLHSGTALLTIGDIVYGPGDIGKIISDASTWYRKPGNRTPKDLIIGLKLSNNVTDANNDIDVSAGRMRDSTDIYEMILIAAMTKRLDATWAAGTNQGGLFTGAKAINTWYHFFLIRKTSDGSIDCGFDTSVTAANIPSGYVAYALVESVLTDGSGNIVQFLQRAGQILRVTPSQVVNGSNPGTAASTRTLNSPPGRRVEGIISVQVTVGSLGTYCYLSSLDMADQAPSNAIFTIAALQVTNAVATGVFRVWTDLSSGIRSRFSASDANVVLIINTLGWQDHRPRVD